MGNWGYRGELLREMTCFQCKNAEEFDKSSRSSTCKCKVTKRRGKLDRGRFCTHFDYRQWHNPIAEDGIPIKNRQPLDYRTKNQWEEVGRTPKEGAQGTEMYASKNSTSRTYTYYLIEDTEEF